MADEENSTAPSAVDADRGPRRWIPFVLVGMGAAAIAVVITLLVANNNGSSPQVAAQANHATTAAANTTTTVGQPSITATATTGAGGSTNTGGGATSGGGSVSSGGGSPGGGASGGGGSTGGTAGGSAPTATTTSAGSPPPRFTQATASPGALYCSTGSGNETISWATVNATFVNIAAAAGDATDRPPYAGQRQNPSGNVILNGCDMNAVELTADGPGGITTVTVSWRYLQAPPT